MWAVHLLVIRQSTTGSVRNDTVCNVFCYMTNSWPKKGVLTTTLSRNDLNITGNYGMLVERINESW